MTQTDLLERLKAGTNNRKTIRFPGSDMDVTISVLSEAQRQEAHFETEQYFKRKSIETSMVTIDAYEAEKSLRMVYKALSDGEGEPLARTIERFRGLLTVDEKNTLVDEYLAFEKDCSAGYGLSEGEIDAILDDVKKKSHSDWERFKYRHSKTAYYLFGKPACDLTMGQWIYILAMEISCESAKRGEGKAYKVRKHAK